MTLSGTITASALRTDFDQHRSTLATNARAGRKDQTRVLRIAAMTSATDLSLRSYAWTQADDHELRILYGRGTTDGAATLTVTLAVENGDDTFLAEQTVTAAVTAGGASTVDTRPTATDYRTTTGTRLRLLKGVRYRLSVAVSAANWSAITIGAQVRSVRRIA